MLPALLSLSLAFAAPDPPTTLLLDDVTPSMDWFYVYFPGVGGTSCEVGVPADRDAAPLVTCAYPPARAWPAGDGATPPEARAAERRARRVIREDHNERASSFLVRYQGRYRLVTAREIAPSERAPTGDGQCWRSVDVAWQWRLFPDGAFERFRLHHADTRDTLGDCTPDGVLDWSPPPGPIEGGSVLLGAWRHRDDRALDALPGLEEAVERGALAAVAP